MTAKQQSRMEWTSRVAEDKSFIRISVVTFFIFVILSLFIPLIEVPSIEKSKAKPIPQRFAKLILEKKKKIEKPKKKELSEAEKAALKKAEDERRKRLEEERKKREAERKKREEELKKKREEDRKKAEAERKKREAELKRKREEERKKAEADRNKSVEDKRKAEAERQRQEAARKKAEAERQRQEVARKKVAAERQRQEAARKKVEAERQRQEAVRRRAEVERQRIAAEKRRVAVEKKKGEDLAANLFGDLAEIPSEPVKNTSGNNALIAKKERTATSKTQSSPNVLTSKTAVHRGSGGIDTGQMTQFDVDSGIDATLESRATTVLEEVDLGVLDGSDIDADATMTTSGQPTRSKRELNMALERKKGRIYKIYQRALRKDPTLGGKVVVKLTILPSGKVESVDIVSSDIDVASFLRKLKTLIKGIKFTSKDVATVVVNYPIDFGEL